MSQATITSNTQTALPAIVVVVPKEDEFTESARAFGITDGERPSTLAGEAATEYFEVETARERIILVAMDDQGNDASQAFATRMIALFEPKLVCLTGTGLGNPEYSNVGAVYFARSVAGLTQIRRTDRGPVYQHVTTIHTHKPLQRDLRDFLELGGVEDVREGVRRRAASLGLDLARPEVSINISLEPLGSGNEYFRGAEADVQGMWLSTPGARAYDMESWGLIQAAELAGVDWLTVRGVSDFGVSGSMSPEHRKLAAFASARALFAFLDSPRQRTAPEQTPALRIDQEVLPETNVYVERSTSVATFQERVGRDLGLEIGPDVLDRALSQLDLVEVLVKAGADREEAEVLLPVVREEYFRDKYLHYEYRRDGHAEDARALAPDWAHSIRRAIADFGLENLVGKTVADVGCGNGLELPGLFWDAREAREIVLVDLPAAFEESARRRLPAGKARYLRGNAENLDDLTDHSIDLYVSLRTYQSRMFDMEAAFREAYRVTRAGGVIAISISNGYASEFEDRRGTKYEAIVPGLKASGIDRSLSKGAPHALMERLRKMYDKFGVSARIFDLPHGELLICGKVGASYAPDIYSSSSGPARRVDPVND